MLDYVAVDLETTGASPDSAAIIEMAAVRFVAGREVESRTWLTNPGLPIPLRWQHLTSITHALVADKPAPEQAVRDLLAFAGGQPLVAHHAPFDGAFIAAACRQAGVASPAVVYDSAELARLVLPRAGSYRLAALARELGFQQPRAHRAADDARACGLVFAHCLHRLDELELSVLLEALRLAPYDWPLRPLYEWAARTREAAGARPRPPSAWIAPSERPLHVEQQPPGRRAEPIDPDEVAGILGPDGPIATVHPQYESRPQQLAMAARVTAALNGARHLLVEAGTGTGKSLAYLVPALLWARQNRETVVISTHTITLQEQLLTREIPLLLQALDCAGEVDVALVKGRSHYVCLRKWDEAVAGADFGTPIDERFFYLRTLNWLSETETGDRAELQLAGAQEEFWSQILSEGETCLGPRCPWFSRHCFAFRARQRARESRILVVNHALLFSDIRAGGGILPRFGNLILDEAHHLEAVATEHLGTSVSGRDVGSNLLRLFRGQRSRNGAGLLPRLRRLLPEPLPARPPVGTADQALHEALTEVARQAEAGSNTLFRAVWQLVQATGGEADGGRSLRLTPAIRRSAAWEAVAEARPVAVGALLQLAEGLTVLETALTDAVPEPRPRELDGLAAEVGKYSVRLREMAAAIDTVLLGDEDDQVYWVEAAPPRPGSAEPQVTLRAAPVYVGDLLRTALFERVRSVVMTSATLTVGGRFDHVRQQLGLNDLPPEQVDTGVVASPFRYREQALVLIPRDVANPRESEAAFQQGVTAFLAALLPRIGGRTLVLFTSHRHLRQVYNELKDPLAAAGLLVLAQGLDGNRGQLVTEFRDGERAVLFGSASFWEGVDIPGEGLSCVVMVRLPFAPPDDPLTAARIEHLERRGYSAFAHLTLPRAIIRFKQGFGRLIRSTRDRGVLIVFDNRIHPQQTRYGSRFLHSLPGPLVQTATVAEVLDRTAAFLGLEP